MAMEIKQDLKLSQQLVMTPQLQQAIKLLQLSRMELVDMVRDEMLENPILEDAVDLEQRAGPRARRDGRRTSSSSDQLEGVGQTETAVEGSVVDGVAQTEVKADAHRRSTSSTGRPTSTTTRGPRRCRPTSRTTRSCRRSSRR